MKTKHIHTSNGMHYIVPVLVGTRQGTSFVLSYVDDGKYMCLCDCGRRFIRRGSNMKANNPTCGDHPLWWRKTHQELDITLTPDQWLDLQQHPKPLDQWWQR